MAAAGFWARATDLARFTIGIQEAVAGETNAILAPETVQMMLTDQKDGDGLGVFLDGSGDGLRFSHEGRDLGFDSYMIAYARQGKGVIVLMNQNTETGITRDIVNLVAKKYGWDRGMSVFPAAWQRDEFFLMHPWFGKLMILTAILVAVAIVRRILRRARRSVRA
jgi:hypothetical protein